MTAAGASGHGRGQRPTPRLFALVVRTFWRWCLGEGLLSDDPWVGIGLPKRRRTHPKPLGEGDLKALLDVIDRGRQRGRFIAHRDWAIVVFLAGTGLRIAECMSLRLDDLPVRRTLGKGVPKVDELHPSFYVVGKGSRRREVPLFKAVRDALNSYLARRHEFLKKGAPACDWLWPNTHGAGRLTEGTFRRALKRYAAQAGISPEVGHPHALRHLFGMLAPQMGLGVYEQAAVMGHADLTMVAHYSHLARNQIAELADRTDVAVLRELVPQDKPKEWRRYKV